MSEVWQVKFDEEQDLLVNRITGSPTIAQLVEVMQEARRHPKWGQHLPVLWDFRGADLSHINLDEIFRIRELAKSIEDPVRPTSIAFATESPLDHGIIRQIISSAGWGDQSYKIFDNVIDAVAWIQKTRAAD